MVDAVSLLKYIGTDIEKRESETWSCVKNHKSHFVSHCDSYTRRIEAYIGSNARFSNRFPIHIAFMAIENRKMEEVKSHHAFICILILFC